MRKVPIKIYDETIRDGEQQVDVFFTYEEKKELFNLIKKAGVNGISVFPAIGTEEKKYVESLVKDGNVDVITSLTMSGRRYIDQALSLGLKRIMLFYSVSDVLLFSESHQSALKTIIENVKYASESGLEVDFGGVDSPRANFDFLVNCINSCKPYIKHFILCDSVGILTPEKSYNWVKALRKRAPGVNFGLHYHNDMGLAVENTIQSLLAGATMVSGTFRGIGERSGNASLEQVLYGLRVRFGIEVVGIDYKAVDDVVNYLKRKGFRHADPYSHESTYHESGIHVDGLMKDTKSFSIFPYNDINLAFGKMSGTSNYKYLFEKKLKDPQPYSTYIRMRDNIKALSINQKKYYTEDEIIELKNRGFFDLKSNL